MAKGSLTITRAAVVTPTIIHVFNGVIFAAGNLMTAREAVNFQIVGPFNYSTPL